MPAKKYIKDIMIGIYEYPHIDSGFSIRQAIKIIKKSLPGKDKYIKPMIALVFDERGLVGTLRLRDILKGLEPNFLRPLASVQGYTEDTAGLSIIWDSLFDMGSKELIERPVSEVMDPITAFVGPDDSVVKAAYLMIHNDLLILPVLEDKKRLIGLIRMIEVFDVLSSGVLDSKKNNLISLRVRA
ncbi:MAG: CBS domain-containing protein [Actinobacteria bacterium]|nr:CBS domain-containing protein [Actinomycetota bacterium]